MNGSELIRNVLNSFTGRDGEPNDESERYILKSMWIMMLSEFEGNIKSIVENYIDGIKQNDMNEIHVCLLIRNFHGDKEEELTLNKIVSFYKKLPAEINYRNFTQDRVPKYKSKAVENLFNYLGFFFSVEEKTQLTTLDSIASTRDAIAHGDFNVQITKVELLTKLTKVEVLLKFLDDKLKK